MDGEETRCVPLQLFYQQHYYLYKILYPNISTIQPLGLYDTMLAMLKNTPS